MPNITWDLIYRDRGVQSGLKGIAGSHDQAERKAKAWKTAAAAGFVVVAAAAVKFGVASVRAYAEAQDAQKALGFAFQKFPALADTNQRALQRLNSEIQKKTRFDDDNIASGQAVLAQFKLTGKQITEVTPLLTDYAAKTGKDIPAAAQDVGKALLGNAKALKNIGIFYKSTGDAGKDFTNVTALMREKVGGFAELEGKTASGQLAILKNQFGELQEAAGAKLVPALTAGVEVLTDLVVVIGDNAEVIVPLAAGIGGLTAAIWLGHKAAKAYAVVQGVMGAAMSSNSRIATGFAAVASKAGPWGIAIAAGATLLGVYAGKQELAKRETKAFTDQLTFQKGALDINSAQMLVKKLADEGALEAAKRAGIAEADYVRALMQGGPARDTMLKQLDDIIVESQAAAEAGTGNTAALLDQRDAAAKASDALKLTGGSLDASKRAAELAATGMQGATTATDELTTKTNQLKGAQKNLNTELQKSIDKFTILKEGALSTERANMAWEESIDAVRQSTKQNGRSLSDHTAKGRSNRTAVINMITALNDKVTADVKNAGAIRKGETAQDRYERVQKTATRATKDGIEKIREHARRAHLNKDAVDRMIEEFLKTPSAAGKMGRGVDRAADKVDRLGDEMRGLRSKGVTARVAFTAGGQRIILKPGTLGGGMTAFDRGGYTGNIPPWQVAGEVHGDEEVIKSPSRRKFEAKYPGYLHHINEKGDLPGYRGGGLVRVTGESGGRPRVGRIADMITDRVIRNIAREAGDNLDIPLGQGITGPVGSLTSFRGGRFTQLAAANLRRAEQIAGVQMHVMQGGWRPRTSYSGTSHAGDAVDTQASAALIRGLRAVGWASGDRTGLGNWGSHAHSVPSPSTGRAGGSAVGQYQDYRRRGGASQSLGSPWGLASGGLLTARVAEEGPERLLSASQTRMWDRMTRVATSQGVGTTIINISAPNYIGSRQELRQTLVDMSRSGAFEVVKR